MTKVVSVSIFCVAFVLVFALVLWVRGQEGSLLRNVWPGLVSETKNMASKEIIEGSIGSVAFYHCGADPSIDPADVKNIVLLHGARFTKEEWKTSGILEFLCNYDKVSVTAFDLSVKAGYGALTSLLESLAQRKMASLPVSALVTPSASGYAVVSALEEGKASAIKVLTNLWIPVASGSVLSLSSDQLNMAKGVSMWATHGDQDSNGRKVSDKLMAEAGADVTEFPGGHSFYLRAPQQFSSALAKKLHVIA